MTTSVKDRDLPLNMLPGSKISSSVEKCEETNGVPPTLSPHKASSKGVDELVALKQRSDDGVKIVGTFF